MSNAFFTLAFASLNKYPHLSDNWWETRKSLLAHSENITMVEGKKEVVYKPDGIYQDLDGWKGIIYRNKKKTILKPC